MAEFRDEISHENAPQTLQPRMAAGLAGIGLQHTLIRTTNSPIFSQKQRFLHGIFHGDHGKDLARIPPIFVREFVQKNEILAPVPGRLHL